MERSTTPQIIDILMAVDADTIISNSPPGTSSKPTSIDETMIYLIVRQENGVFGEGTGELKVTARTLDTLRWRETSLSANATYSAILYKYEPIGGEQGILSTPYPIVAEVKTPLPVPGDPLHPVTQTINSYFWSAQAVAEGEITYAFNFMLTDRDNIVQGYYSWDPFIQITA
ncbi:AidA/PixA family protein [Vreelandella venusta]|uniref:AidA/PixA family protein n=1 Tax=Vreelandella venusta TaxID=44935 RepID=UPI00200E38F3|nr:AidA/PixA family protein [Halomonas venusta]UQI42246.1 inclusion body family protein [Halomonas venusta]